MVVGLRKHMRIAVRPKRRVEETRMSPDCPIAVTSDSFSLSELALVIHARRVAARCYDAELDGRQQLEGGGRLDHRPASAAR